MREKKLNISFYALISFVVSIFILAGSLIPVFFVFGQTLIYENFENYNLGNLHNQGGWVEYYGQTSFQVTDTLPHTGTKSINCVDCDTTRLVLNTTFEKKSFAYIYFWVYLSAINGSGEYNPTVQLVGCKEANPTECYSMGGIQIKRVNGIYGFGYRTDTSPYYTELKSDLEKNKWHEIGIKFDENDWKYQVKIDNEDWSDLITMNRQDLEDEIDAIYGVTIAVLTPNSNLIYIDDFSGHELGYYAIIEPEIPEDCENTIMDFDDAQFKGKITIPTENQNVNTDLKIILYPLEGMGEKIIDLEMPELVGGQSWSWNKENLNIHEFGSYEVIYMLSGYNPNTMEYFTYFHRGESICGEKTKIFHGQAGWTEIPLEEWKGEEIEAREDCSSYDWITNMGQRLFCELSNFAKDIFFPSNQKIWELKENLGQFRTKFPFNYISEIGNFFSDVKESLEIEKSIPFKILGQEANVDFSFWNNQGEVGGMTESFSNLLKDFSTLIIIIGFFTWLLYFIRRFW